MTEAKLYCSTNEINVRNLIKQNDLNNLYKKVNYQISHLKDFFYFFRSKP